MFPTLDSQGSTYSYVAHGLGGVPAVVAQLIGQGLIQESALTVNGKTIGDNCRDATIEDAKVIKTFDDPLVEEAGFLVLSGNLFDAAIMKTSVLRMCAIIS